MTISFLKYIVLVFMQNLPLGDLISLAMRIERVNRIDYPALVCRSGERLDHLYTTAPADYDQGKC